MTRQKQSEEASCSSSTESTVKPLKLSICIPKRNKEPEEQQTLCLPKDEDEMLPASSTVEHTTGIKKDFSFENN